MWGAEGGHCGPRLVRHSHSEKRRPLKGTDQFSYAILALWGSAPKNNHMICLKQSLELSQLVVEGFQRQMVE